MTNVANSVIIQKKWENTQKAGYNTVKSKGFLSTGEAAKLLGISRATVARKFEKDIFTGKKNPLTGDRRISIESLKMFMKKFKLSTISFTGNSITVLVVTADDEFKSLINQALEYKDGFEIIFHANGVDALATCAKENVKIVVIDHKLPDIHGGEIISTLRRMKVLDEVKILHYVREWDSKKYSRKENEDYIENKHLSSILLREKINKLLDLKTEDYNIAVEHERLYQRVNVNIPAESGSMTMKILLTANRVPR